MPFIMHPALLCPVAGWTKLDKTGRNLALIWSGSGLDLGISLQFKCATNLHRWLNLGFIPVGAVVADALKHTIYSIYRIWYYLSGNLSCSACASVQVKIASWVGNFLGWGRTLIVSGGYLRVFNAFTVLIGSKSGQKLQKFIDFTAFCILLCCVKIAEICGS